MLVSPPAAAQCVGLRVAGRAEHRARPGLPGARVTAAGAVLRLQELEDCRGRAPRRPDGGSCSPFPF